MKTAEDLRIGDVVARTKEGDALQVKVLHELCHERRTPHVHAIISGGATKCLDFKHPVAESR